MEASHTGPPGVVSPANAGADSLGGTTFVTLYIFGLVYRLHMISSP